MSLERKLLAALCTPDDIAQVFDMGLAAEAFEEPLSANVYQFIVDYWHDTHQEQAPPVYAVETSNPGYKTWVDDEPVAASWAATELMKRFATNGVQRMITAAASTCHHDPIATLRALQSDAYDASETILPRHSRSDMATNIEERRRRYSEREQGIGVGVTLGLSELDEHVGFLLPGELAAIGAFSKVGKTMFLMLAAVAARRAGWNPIIFSLEMPVDQIEDRMDAMFAKVSYNRMSKRSLGIEELKILFAAQTAMAEMGPVRIESPDEGERTVSHLISRARHTGSNFVLIDQLSFMEETRRYPSEKQRQASILKQLKNEIGRGSRGKLPCLLAVQLKRESLEHKDGLELSDFADAAEVERTCDLLLGLSRSKEQRMNRTMRMDIMGARRSDERSWVLHWDLTDTTDIHVRNEVVGGQAQAVTPIVSTLAPPTPLPAATIPPVLVALGATPPP